MSAAAGVSDAVLRQAAEWLVQLQCGELHGEQARAFEAWRAADPAHAQAWSRAQGLLAQFEQVPAPVLRDAARLRSERRRLLRGLAWLAVAAPAGWAGSRLVPWQAWSADLRTATGEIRSVALTDGTELVLGTATALDVRYGPDERLLWLRAGEIMIQTAPDPAGRPFVVRTAQGRLRALGTRFTVRGDGARTWVAVFDGAVEVSPTQGAPHVLQAGEALDLDDTGAGRVAAADEAAAAWTRGMLAVHDRPLGEVVAELARYRPGVLRCDPAIADLPVSGAFPLRDTDASLALLAQTLPLRVVRITPYWVTVRPVRGA
ncbi:iron dicitrate transport regulator FecR [Bordetella genomosp. 5]|uniref:FecR domain-containing protein n=1 Tax=Bordetella genomosp. 5 TaxID=1395608 RepID=UPI000B9E8CC9|nr:FecR domain-containing protein [Bordetella genomosp. 5]OZI46097.1 iron dicitrate transport regulator FecR [Bordetella genomosp. 5]